MKVLETLTGSTLFLLQALTHSQSLCVSFFFFLTLHECPAKTCLEGVTEVVGGAGVTPAFD